VFVQEFDDPLFALESIILIPHMVCLNEEAGIRVTAEVANEVLRVLRSGKPEYHVNSEVYLNQA